MLSLQQMFGVGPARNQEFESFAITSYLQAADKSRSLHSLRTNHVTSHLHREFEIEILHHLERSTDPATVQDFITIQSSYKLRTIITNPIYPQI